MELLKIYHELPGTEHSMKNLKDSSRSLKKTSEFHRNSRQQKRIKANTQFHVAVPKIFIMNRFSLGSRSSKTFKPKKNIPEGTHQYDLMKHAAATLGSGNLRLAVMLPEGEDLNEWVAVNTVDFFNQINMLFGTITEFCTEESCPIMSAGPKYEYHWADGHTVKKPIKCSAPKYIDYLMTWVQDQLDDETLFPSKIGVPFPKNFLSIAKTILKRLFRVYAHIYHQHFSEVVQLGEEAHLNTSFKHFIFFVQEFNLIERRELAPLQELIEKLTAKDAR
ncbi:hypothetical protein E2986_11079 [Frieseomelitta varia]|uniref:MOB kinase activator-like 1 n=3 Tax=Apocrita TaxID=7400 RepID=A0A833WA82_9HYME|nr:hypothetical protein E2986_11079 [Frieseomelitta varia]